MWMHELSLREEADVEDHTFFNFCILKGNWKHVHLHDVENYCRYLIEEKYALHPELTSNFN